MIAAWMAAATIFAALIAAAAVAVERALRANGRSGRAVWAFALAASAGWPLLAPAFIALAHRLQGAAVHVALAAGTPAAATLGSSVVWRGAAWLPYADAALIALWVAASFALVSRFVLALLALARVERSAHRAVMEGIPVLVTPMLGPAVFGVRRPRLLVPRWLGELDAPLRAIVLCHEQEHCAARDPGLTLAAALIVAAMPWNIALWWIARRLRLAVEIDCDARVLRRVPDAERYSRLLLLIAQRQAHVQLASMLAESNSHLGRRIDAMHAAPSRNRGIRTALFAVAAAGAIALSTKYATKLLATPSLPTFPSRVSPPVAVPAPLARVSPPVVVPAPPAPPIAADTDRHPLAIAGSAAPRYPDILKEAGVEGGVIATFVVKADGTADSGSVKIAFSSHALFGKSVAAAIPNMRFAPATAGGRSVAELVQQMYVFTIAGSPLSTPDGVHATIDHILSQQWPNSTTMLAPVVITGPQR